MVRTVLPIVGWNRAFKYMNGINNNSKDKKKNKKRKEKMKSDKLLKGGYIKSRIFNLRIRTNRIRYMFGER